MGVVDQSETVLTNLSAKVAIRTSKNHVFWTCTTITDIQINWPIGLLQKEIISTMSRTIGSFL